ncbi:MAG: hypothetical protein E7223_01200 [Clostridiales bacterium]|nr:hypothetical protein [Clostridiales bacterium]
MNKGLKRTGRFLLALLLCLVLAACGNPSGGSGSGGTGGAGENGGNGGGQQAVAHYAPISGVLRVPAGESGVPDLSGCRL